MARFAVFASGRGTNFVAIAHAVRGLPSHSIEFLLCDVEGAQVLERARELGIPSHLVTYSGRPRRAAEADVLSLARRYRVDLIALAGFMKLLTPSFLKSFKGPIINLHPSLLPKHPGTHGIEESFLSEDRELGITIMRVDEGVDTGPVIAQKRFTRTGAESLDEIEEKIHVMEHEWYPRILIELLDRIDHQGEN